jgi:signal transduction histidine kinase/DNA-binding NarL/FixJ family response regulator
MGLRLRTSLIVTGAFTAMAVATYILFSSFLLKEFGKVERDRAEINSTRVKEALLGIQEDLAIRANDWGFWDDTYHFMERKNQFYIDSNLNHESLTQFDLTHVIYLKLDGSPLYGVAISSAGRMVTQVPTEVEAEILEVPAVKTLVRSPSDVPKHGIAIIAGEPLFVAISTVRDSKQKYEPNGFIVFTQRLSQSVRERLFRRLRLQVDFATYPFAGEAKSVIERSLERDSKWPKVEQFSYSTRVFDMVTDSLSQPAILFSLAMDRDIFRQGISARNYLFSLLAVFFVLTNFALITLLDKAVIGRLKMFVARIADITSTNDPSLRISVKGRDEFSHLAVSFNHLLSVIDRTYKDLNTARNIAESANQAKTDFIAKVSHELRTPIHSIMGLLRVVRKKITDPPTRTQIGMIRDAALGLLGVVNDILDFSKGGSEGLTVSQIEMDLRDVVRRAMRTVAPRVFEKKGLECFSSVDNSIPVTVVGDPKRLSQILVNILSNSVKFTNYGYIKLSVERLAGEDTLQMIEFSVEDTGVGIKAEKLSEIFDPFIQADNSAQRQYQGTGLGLTIVKQLVEGMGGTVGVESSINQGAKFTFRIPLLAPEPASLRYCDGLQDKQIAIINNSRSEGVALMKAFEALGCGVTLFNTSKLSSMDTRYSNLESFDFIVVSGNVIENNHTRLVMESACRNGRGHSVLATLSPFELTHRELLLGFGIDQVLLAPLIVQDVPAALIGEYTEDLSGYEDFIELENISPMGRNILVADDIPANQVVIKCLLEDAGHRVTIVSNGEELLDAVGHLLGMRERRASDQDYDLVLTDVQMPIMDGLAATRHIREMEAKLGADFNARLPVIAVTAHATIEQQPEIFDCGIDGLVIKPIDPRELEAAIERVFSVVDKNTPAAKKGSSNSSSYV